MAGAALAVVRPHLTPYVADDGTTLTLGVECSHGNDVMMSWQSEWVDDYRFDWRYQQNANGSQELRLTCHVSLINGDVASFGARTLPHHPWVRPLMGGKGHGRGAPPADGAAGGVAVPPPPAP